MTGTAGVARLTLKFALEKGPNPCALCPLTRQKYLPQFRSGLGKTAEVSESVVSCARGEYPAELESWSS